jgi:peroxiredoxin
MRNRFYLIVMAVIVLNVAIFLYFDILRRSSGAHLTYGESFPQRSAIDLNGQPVEWSGRWAVLVYFALESGEGLRHARYADILFHRFQGRGLRVVAVVRGDPSQIRTSDETASLSYPIVVDKDRYWAKQLALEEHSFGVFIR